MCFSGHACAAARPSRCEAPAPETLVPLELLLEAAGTGDGGGPLGEALRCRDGPSGKGAPRAAFPVARPPRAGACGCPSTEQRWRFPICGESAGPWVPSWGLHDVMGAAPSSRDFPLGWSVPHLRCPHRHHQPRVAVGMSWDWISYSVPWVQVTVTCVLGLSSRRTQLAGAAPAPHWTPCVAHVEASATCARTA